MFVPLAVLDFLNSREDALLLWVIVTAALVLSKVPAARLQLLAVIRSFFAPKLLFGLWIPVTIYVLALLYFAHAKDVWHATSLRETVYWYAGTAIVLAGGATQANDPARFWKLFRRVVKVTIVIEFLVNLYVFPFVVELFLIPLLVIFGGMQAVAELDPKLAPARRVIGWVLSTVGVFLVTHAITSAVRDLDGLFTWEHVEQFLVPVVLTLAFAPFLYYVALRSTYEQLFVRLGIYGQDRKTVRRAKWALVRVCRLSLRKIGRLSGRFFAILHSVRPDADVTDLVREFETELRAAEREDRAQAA
jgi:hypothetical protein